jgi:imidazole glycerol-phosphate synthase subunit HisH
VIALIDYGAGNLTSVRKGLSAAGARPWTPRSPRELAGATGIVVPGVGHFAATAALDENWRRAVADAVDRGTPLLGICLGMQWLFEGSEEAPGVRGLAMLPGVCFRLRGGTMGELGPAKVPHVGWNSLETPRPSRLGLARGTHVYFTHSFAAPVTEAATATCAHGDDEFAAVVESANVFGVQFHPEKSGAGGLRILAQFVNLTRGEGPAGTFAKATAPREAGHDSGPTADENL